MADAIEKLREAQNIFQGELENPDALEAEDGDWDDDISESRNSASLSAVQSTSNSVAPSLVQSSRDSQRMSVLKPRASTSQDSGRLSSGLDFTSTPEKIRLPGRLLREISVDEVRASSLSPGVAKVSTPGATNSLTGCIRQVFSRCAALRLDLSSPLESLPACEVREIISVCISASGAFKAAAIQLSGDVDPLVAIEEAERYIFRIVAGLFCPEDAAEQLLEEERCKRVQATSAAQPLHESSLAALPAQDPEHAARTLSGGASTAQESISTRTAVTSAQLASTSGNDTTKAGGHGLQPIPVQSVNELAARRSHDDEEQPRSKLGLPVAVT
eukprot:gene29768-37125_t